MEGSGTPQTMSASTVGQYGTMQGTVQAMEKGRLKSE